jgi:CheY-like chemotaxis protein
MSSKILVVEDEANERQGSADLLPDSGLVQSGRLKR